MQVTFRATPNTVRTFHGLPIRRARRANVNTIQGIERYLRPLIHDADVILIRGDVVNAVRKSDDSGSPSMSIVLVSLLDEAFQKKSWHGTNLRGSLRSISAKDAAWSPGRGRKSIWEHVLHAAYWKYVVRRRLLGEKRGSFPLAGSNWFPVPPGATQKDWQAAIKLLEKEHRLLRDAVASLSEKGLRAKPGGSKLDNAFMIRGIALHDIYHTGQIQFIKKMLKSRG